MKSFMEGNGYIVEEKMVHPYIAFTGACSYFCSNELPPVAFTGSNSWGAIRQRTNFYMAGKEMMHDDDGDFPMKAPMLAHIWHEMLIMKEEREERE